MYRNKIGRVTDEEKNILLTLYEKSFAFIELKKGLTNLELNEEEVFQVSKKIDAEFEENNLRKKEWWNKICSKYKWNYNDSTNFIIEFSTNYIYTI